jgi:hypothetical protein
MRGWRGAGAHNDATEPYLNLALTALRTASRPLTDRQSWATRSQSTEPSSTTSRGSSTGPRLRSTLGYLTPAEYEAQIHQKAAHAA